MCILREVKTKLIQYIMLQKSKMVILGNKLILRISNLKVTSQIKLHRKTINITTKYLFVSQFNSVGSITANNTQHSVTCQITNNHIDVSSLTALI